ncbi:MAG: hypothetical protein ABIE22_00535 [archaeon]
MVKCEICSEVLEKNELGKLNGAVVKVKSNNKNEFKHVCSDCQRQGKDKELKG